MPTFSQASFSKGELDPALHGRTDTGAYQIALATARNAIVQPYGGIVNRPGLQYLGPCKDHSTAVRIIDFQFKNTDTYVIELGNLYARFIRADAIVTETSTSAQDVATITAAAPPVVTTGTHLYSNGDEVLLSGLTEATELNGNRYIVANKTATTFEITLQADGGVVPAPAVAESTGGTDTCKKVYEIVTPWTTADLFELKYTQSADTMTIVHPSYAPRHLTRTASNVFVLTTPTFAPTNSAPTGMQVTVGVTTNVKVTKYHYKVTAFDSDGQESLSALNNNSITGITATAANPPVCTKSSHGLETGDEIEISAAGEMTELNGRRFLITVTDANTFTLDDEDASGYAAEVATGFTANLTHVEISTAPNVLSTQTGTIQKVEWLVVASAKKYAIYRSSTGSYGLIGETTNIVFNDTIDTPDTQFTPPTARNPFLNSGDWPGAVSYFEQRRVFGGTTDNPDTSYYSRVGFPDNLSSSSPTVDGVVLIGNLLWLVMLLCLYRRTKQLSGV